MRPYKFHRRRDRDINDNSLKREPTEFHDCLNHDCYDIAFEIVWTTLTPTALNPTIDITQRDNLAGFEEGKYSGYNRRWLMIDNRLAISPFTVKSAIANAYANLVGGCYRVNTRIEGHKTLERGKYPYGGGYKRYRVAMDGSSKPGIILSIEKLKNGDREVLIQPVREFYLDEDVKDNLKPGETYYVDYYERKSGKTNHVSDHERNPLKPSIITITSEHDSLAFQVKYHGPYTWGKDSMPSSKHLHRFYIEEGEPIRGIIPAINFLDKNTLKKYVCLGGADARGIQHEWYQDLNDLEPGSFVYYEEFDGEVTNIGKNFLFKALFFHEDAVPESNRACSDPTSLCPRCRLFGMIKREPLPFESQSEQPYSEAPDDSTTTSGLKGRFKASTLIGDKILTERKFKLKIPIPSIGFKEVEAVAYYEAEEDTDEEPVCKQYLLPILGEPKPNKRDVDGYYDKITGKIKGAKYYLHALCDLDEIIEETDRKSYVGKGMPYAHDLRNFAVVCRPDESFKGVVAVENATIDEISALILILHTPIAGSGFKVGLGKPLGMGSISSKIEKIWIRDRDYKWKTYDLESFLKEKKEIQERVKNLSKTCELVNALLEEEDKFTVPNQKLIYPDPGPYYWKTLNRE